MLENKNACLVLNNGTILKGFGYGATGIAVAELFLILQCLVIKKSLQIHLTKNKS